MSKKPYNLASPVCWKKVVKNMEWSLSVRSGRAFDALSKVNIDRIHNNFKELNVDICKALTACEEVFFQYRVLSSLRRFLQYKVKTPVQLGLTQFMLFYLKNKENPRSEDLAIQHCEDSDDQ